MHYEVDMDNCYAAIIQVFKCQVDETHGFMISTNFPTCSYSLDLCQPWKIKCFKEQKNVTINLVLIVHQLFYFIFMYNSSFLNQGLRLFRKDGYLKIIVQVVAENTLATGPSHGCTSMS